MALAGSQHDLPASHAEPVPRPGAPRRLSQLECRLTPSREHSEQRTFVFDGVCLFSWPRLEDGRTFDPSIEGSYGWLWRRVRGHRARTLGGGHFFS